MKCSYCGIENPDDAKFCQKCAKPLAPSNTVPEGVMQSTPTPKSKSRTLVIVAVVVLVLVVIGVVGAFVVVKSPKADLRGDLSWEATQDFSGLANSGTITVYGTIYNDGDKDGSGTVQLNIYDGFEWNQYTQSTGTVSAHGSVEFHWSLDYDMMDADFVEAQYKLV